MSIFNFNNESSSCQKGFLLVELLVALAFALGLSLGMVAWYGSCMAAYEKAQWRMGAIVAATSHLHALQTAQKTPLSGKHTVLPYCFDLRVASDNTIERFYWVIITVTDEKGRGGEVSCAGGVQGGA